MSVTLYKSTRHHIPEDFNLHQRHYENQKSHIEAYVWYTSSMNRIVNFYDQWSNFPKGQKVEKEIPVQWYRLLVLHGLETYYGAIRRELHSILNTFWPCYGSGSLLLCFFPWSPRFSPRPVHVELVVGKMTLGQVSSGYSGCPFSIIPSVQPLTLCNLGKLTILLNMTFLSTDIFIVYTIQVHIMTLKEKCLAVLRSIDIINVYWCKIFYNSIHSVCEFHVYVAIMLNKICWNLKSIVKSA